MAEETDVEELPLLDKIVNTAMAIAGPNNAPEQDDFMTAAVHHSGEMSEKERRLLQHDLLCAERGTSSEGLGSGYHTYDDDDDDFAERDWWDDKWENDYDIEERYAEYEPDPEFHVSADCPMQWNDWYPNVSKDQVPEYKEKLVEDHKNTCGCSITIEELIARMIVTEVTW